MKDLIKKLRDKLTEYRHSVLLDKGEASIHVNAIDIALGLAEFGLEENREIRKDEEGWFKARYHLDFVFGVGKWNELTELYNQLVTEVQTRNYFRK